MGRKGSGIGRGKGDGREGRERVDRNGKGRGREGRSGRVGDGR